MSEVGMRSEITVTSHSQEPDGRVQGMFDLINSDDLLHVNKGLAPKTTCEQLL